MESIEIALTKEDAMTLMLVCNMEVWERLEVKICNQLCEYEQYYRSTNRYFSSDSVIYLKMCLSEWDALVNSCKRYSDMNEKYYIVADTIMDRINKFHYFGVK